MTFPLRFLRQIAGTIRGRSVLLAEIHQEVRALHESIGSLRALFLSEKLSRAEVGYDIVITPSEINNQHGTVFWSIDCSAIDQTFFRFGPRIITEGITTSGMRA